MTAVVHPSMLGIADLPLKEGGVPKKGWED
jgi:hypothetical protein